MNLQQLADRIIPDVPGAVLASVRDAIGWALRDLCIDAGVWTVDVPVVVGEQVLTVPSGALPVRVLHIRTDGAPARCEMFQPTPERLVVRSGPDAMTATVVVQPELPIVESALPGWLLDLHFECLQTGARYYLRRMPSKPWTDMDLALMDQRAFHGLCTNARSLTWAGHQAGSIRMRTPRA
ncbi:hypothetical protein ACUHOO_000783 [Pseudomonas aeruginosa]|jgi:hypothetical protein|uniref:hypothetical protein n=1 Tax=Pseudomonas aeruginosa TaxID=287 RepID=UPI000360A6F0|nr:hypothetical protein [Pseudomonas aeruginosa]EIU3316467.1 hypothetical protein [Pseudomonas aeruginosa]EIY2512142.1 hypothetical protein [Pseudomonas aeruginosa]EIY2820314.1 hypothetical protein [Pseudomonas aeruginosa]EKT8668872.1 hypothetical protein [Pseudomonas aeruginosa]EKU2957365.1 hypothetical protein [Pseudomonas aeruginosa]